MTSSYLNEWLDEYNDYIRLYELFGDNEYLEEAKEIISSLRAIATREKCHQIILGKVMDTKINLFK
ncbi:hypothetical protein O9H85_29375 [Paenibacillus filicis]|uniref:Uncharacterized protein n=1 Tax=Paenibacillus gyeongsangnamensis TaxID=3388067 RepID=A0ABT4QI22_9BACL|nr:hypothetical protein [Paenibacillus filicis]MCZ8516427.1 hypothetical protein [Paenibacillus filicis]